MIVEISADQWREFGRRLFGDDEMLWRFECPCCGHHAAIQDFQQYKERGSTPSSATNECLGRYAGGRSAFEAKFATGAGPCNYAGFGLFQISPVHVITDRGTIHSFAFAIPAEADDPHPGMATLAEIERWEARRDWRALFPAALDAEVAESLAMELEGAHERT